MNIVFRKKNNGRLIVRKKDKKFSFRLIIIVILLLSLFAIGSTGYYSYLKITESIKFTEEIALLRYEVLPEVYNFKEFEHIIDVLKQKTDKSDPISMRDVNNPFQPYNAENQADPAALQIPAIR